jgi:hypothetical protein
MHYLRGKADWMLRGLPCAPEPSPHDKLRAIPYFINNLVPGIRATWIAISGRPTVGKSAKDDLSRLRAAEATSASALRSDVVAVVLNSEGQLLGAIEKNGAYNGAVEAINPAPQTIRPDMTHRLAEQLLEHHRYILVTTSFGKYLGRYEPPANAR